MAVLAFHSLVSVTDLSQYDLETEWRQTNQICKNNKRKTDCREIHFEKHRRKRKKHPPITISLGIIIPAFHNNCSSSSETSKYAIGVTAGLFQKHFIFEHPSKTKHVFGFAILFLPHLSLQSFMWTVKYKNQYIPTLHSSVLCFTRKNKAEKD